MIYSVLNEPVIPVLWPDGSSSSIGIREVFLRAHEIRDIQGDTPLERYALLRLLIAFAMDMLHPKDSFERRDLLDAGRFDPGVFDAYVAMCEKDGPRFDLFDPNHPFLQSAYDEKLDAKALKNVANLLPYWPSGNNHIFIDHRYEDDHFITPTQSLGALCTIYLFCFAVGRQGYPSGVNNTSPIYVTILGSNLFETIILNMLSQAETLPIPYGIGDVPWRAKANVIPCKEYANVSLIEAYSWMPRRITLHEDADGLIRKVSFQQGHNFRGNDQWRDPQVPYRINKQGIQNAILPVIGRQLWRDVPSLIYEKTGSRQPRTLVCYQNVCDDIPSLIPIRMMGLICNKAKYVIWDETTLFLPPALIKDEDMAGIFRMDTERIETIQSCLFSIVKNIIDQPLRDKKKQSEFIKGLTTKSQPDSSEHTMENALQSQQYFLHGAHDLLFGPLIEEIVRGIPEKEHVDHFCEAVRVLLRDTIRDVINTTGNNAKAMLQQIDAEKQIWGLFTKLTKEWKECYDGA